jgi:thiol-disulfide isomerase/thioredoxin
MKRCFLFLLVGALRAGAIAVLRSDNFEEFCRWKEGRPETAVVVVQSPSCQACSELQPHFEEAALRLDAKVAFGAVEGPSEPDLVERLGVEAYPTLLLYRFGLLLDEFTGVPETKSITAWIERNALPVVTEVTDLASLQAFANRTAYDSVQTMVVGRSLGGCNARGAFERAVLKDDSNEHAFAWWNHFPSSSSSSPVPSSMQAGQEGADETRSACDSDDGVFDVIVSFCDGDVVWECFTDRAKEFDCCLTRNYTTSRLTGVDEKQFPEWLGTVDVPVLGEMHALNTLLYLRRNSPIAILYLSLDEDHELEGARERERDSGCMGISRSDFATCMKDRNKRKTEWHRDKLDLLSSLGRNEFQQLLFAWVPLSERPADPVSPLVPAESLEGAFLEIVDYSTKQRFIYRGVLSDEEHVRAFFFGICF